MVLAEYDPGMTTYGKIAVSLPQWQIDLLKKAVAEGRGPSVSALVSEAITDYDLGDTLEDFVRDLEAEFGEPSPEAKARAAEIMASPGFRDLKPDY